jgi:hypothetical protein
MSQVTCLQTYDPDQNIIYVTFPQVLHLETQAEIREHFDHVVAFWEDNCGGRKVYYVVGYDGFTVNLRENDFYAEQMRRIKDQCALNVVRYGGDAFQRTAARLYNMKLHAPSQLYQSKEEAMAVVQGIRAGGAAMR